MDLSSLLAVTLGNSVSNALSAGKVDSGGDLFKLGSDLLSTGGSSQTIDSVLDVLKNKGLQKQVESWISNGDNIPVAPEEIAQSVPTEITGELADKTGVSQNKIPELLAVLLPVLVNKITPDGRQPSDKLVNIGVSVLQGLLK